MLEGGEDVLFIVRRMVIFAAEDIGNADPQALAIAIAAKEAVHFVGLPEARIPLAQAVTYLASAPKSNASYTAMSGALADVQKYGPLPVPFHLRNAPNSVMKKIGYGEGYQYAHDQPGGFVTQTHLPNNLKRRNYYRPTENGYEKIIGKHLEAYRGKRHGKKS